MNDAGRYLPRKIRPARSTNRTGGRPRFPRVLREYAGRARDFGSKCGPCGDHGSPGGLKEGFRSATSRDAFRLSLSRKRERVDVVVSGTVAAALLCCATPTRLQGVLLCSAQKLIRHHLVWCGASVTKTPAATLFRSVCAVDGLRTIGATRTRFPTALFRFRVSYELARWVCEMPLCGRGVTTRRFRV